MVKLRNITLAALAGAALVAAQGARADEQPSAAPATGQGAPAGDQDGSWTTSYGMIFSLENVFQNTGILNDFDGGVGLQLNRDPTTAWRFSVNLGHTSNPVVVETTTINGVTSKSLAIPTGSCGAVNDLFGAGPNDLGCTSTFDVGVGAMYVKRLTAASLSPYAGLGGSLFYRSRSVSFDKDSDVDPVNQTWKISASDNTYGIGLGAALGVDWRIHKSVSLFAEYGLGVSLMSVENASAKETDVDLATGATGVFEAKFTRTRFLEFGTGLTQGAQLGLIAYF